jgi:hypothetical protein
MCASTGRWASYSNWARSARNFDCIYQVPVPDVEKVWAQDLDQLDDVLEVADAFVDNILRTKTDYFSKSPPLITRVNLLA